VNAVGSMVGDRFAGIGQPGDGLLWLSDKAALIIAGGACRWHNSAGRNGAKSRVYTFALGRPPIGTVRRACVPASYRRAGRGPALLRQPTIEWAQKPRIVSIRACRRVAAH
jgi:hypothetical protein